jgi:hypothetical protein
MIGEKSRYHALTRPQEWATFSVSFFHSQVGLTLPHPSHKLKDSVDSQVSNLWLTAFM